MAEDLVMRSFYLSAKEDTRLRNLAFQLDLSKSDLVREAIRQNLEKWREINDPDAIFRDIKLGQKKAALEDPFSFTDKPRRSKRPKAESQSAASG
jgi:predicted DNA-binding protein